MAKRSGIVLGWTLVAVLGCSSGSSGGAGGASGKGGAGPNGGTTGGGGVATTGGCDIFPADNPWNQDVSGLPLHASSATYLSSMSPTTAFHPDWGTVSDGYGFPFSSGTGAAPQPINWSASCPARQARASSATPFR